MSTLTYFGSQSVNDWRGMVDHLKKAGDEYRRALPIMTQYEAASIGQSIAEKKEQYRPTIEAGALAVWEGAKNNLQGALTIVEREKRKVTNSWDDSKLLPALQVYEIRVDHAADNADLDGLQSLYQEAKDSGDKYKQRAACEALATLTSKIPAGSQDIHGDDMRMAANRLAKQAGHDLETLRTSPELTAAHELTAAKVEELQQAKNLIIDTADTMGELAPNGTQLHNSRFIKALESVTQDDEGNFIFTE